jgi:hypothetical protein
MSSVSSSESINTETVAAAAREASSFKPAMLGRAPVSARMLTPARAPRESKVGSFLVTTIDQVWASVNLKDGAQVAQAIKHSFILQETKQTEMLGKLDKLLAQQFSAASRETATLRVKVCNVCGRDLVRHISIIILSPLRSTLSKSSSPASKTTFGGLRNWSPNHVSTHV